MTVRLTTAVVGATAITAALLTGVAGTPAAAATGTASATVFYPNPVQTLGDESLTDMKDADYPALAPAYRRVTLSDLDGSGALTGTYVTVKSETGPAAQATGGAFPAYHRDSDQFEQVMGYFWVTRAQIYLHTLGFGETLPGVLNEPFSVKINQYGGDNSYQTDKPFRIRLGKGGVDDAEDAEVIVHEYGHAVHASQVPGYGSSLDAGSIGEGWGDYLAVTVGLDAAEEFGWPVAADPSCPMDWDSTSYTTAPHCIRSFHTGLTVADRRGEVHYDGQIWSQALWEIREGYEALGLSTRDWDTTLIYSQFSYAPDTSFQAAAAETYAAAAARDGQAAADLVRDRFAARGITF